MEAWVPGYTTSRIPGYQWKIPLLPLQPSLHVTFYGEISQSNWLCHAFYYSTTFSANEMQALTSGIYVPSSSMRVIVTVSLEN